MLKRTAWLLAAVLALAGLLVGVSHAATLPLTSSQLESYSYSHPCAGTATASASGTSASNVNINLPSNCMGLDLKVVVRDSSGNVVTSGAGVSSSQNVTVPVGAFTPKAGLSVETDVAGWFLPTSWTFTAPPSSGPVSEGNSATALTTINWTTITNNPVQACFDATVTTESSTPVEWRINVDLSKAPFNGTSANGFVLLGNDSWRYQKYASTPSAGFMQIGGTSSGGRQTISKGQTYVVTVCNYSLPDGAQTPSAYSVTHSKGTWNANQACVITTVTGNGTERFFFGWTATVDMREAVARLNQSGKKLSAYTYGPDEWKLTRTDLGSNTFQVTSRSPASLNGTASFSFTTCAMSY